MLAQNLSPPVLGILPLDNLSKCRRLLPRDHPEFNEITRNHNTISSEDKRQSLGNSIVKKPKKTPLLLESIAENLRKGPFSVLLKCAAIAAEWPIPFS